MRHVDDGKLKTMREGEKVLHSITDREGNPIATTLIDADDAREAAEQLQQAAKEAAAPPKK